MGNSWDHRVERLSDEQIERARERLEKTIREEIAEKGQRASYRHYEECAMGRREHKVFATYIVSYSYVTGRQGRVSYAEKRVCEEHAGKFAVKNKLDFDLVEEYVIHDRAAVRALKQLGGIADE